MTRVHTLCVALCVWAPCAATVWVPCAATAEDVVNLKTGVRKRCTITGMQGEYIRALLQPVSSLPPIPISIHKDLAAGFEFGPNPERDKVLLESSRIHIEELRLLWENFAPFLPFKGTPSGRIGLRLGIVLLETADVSSCSEGLEVFSQIAREAANPSDREAAEQGKLRAWKALGRTREAVAAAQNILQNTKSGNLLAEASLITAEASASELAQLLEENPRWEEDETAARERARLYDATLDHYLLPTLLPDVSQDLAIRGLWGSLCVQTRCNDLAHAAETARDILAWHPGTAYANQAAAFLAGLPAEIRSRRDAHPPRLPELAPLHATPTAARLTSHEETKPSVTEKPPLDAFPTPPKRRKRSGNGNK